MKPWQTLIAGAVLLSPSLPANRPPSEEFSPASLQARFQEQALFLPFLRMLKPILPEATIQINRQAAASFLERVFSSDDVMEQLEYLAEQADRHSSGHIDGVSGFAAAIAQELGQEPEEVEAIRAAARVHDIGKIRVPDEILKAARGLTSVEREIMKHHALDGGELLSGYKGRIDGPLLLKMIQVAEGHHEWFNGEGYPRGRRARWIPLPARIVAVADVYDALISERSYKKRWTEKAAFAEIQKRSGTQFDPEVVAAFERVLHRPWWRRYFLRGQRFIPPTRNPGEQHFLRRAA